MHCIHNFTKEEFLFESHLNRNLLHICVHLIPNFFSRHYLLCENNKFIYTFFRQLRSSTSLCLPTIFTRSLSLSRSICLLLNTYCEIRNQITSFSDNNRCSVGSYYELTCIFVKYCNMFNGR